MRLESITVNEHPPIEKFTVENLSNIVVLAGPNGVGKTRLISGILDALRNPGATPHRRRVVCSTNDREKQEWGRDTRDTWRVKSPVASLRGIVSFGGAS